MEKSATLNLRVNPELKQDAESVLNVKHGSVLIINQQYSFFCDLT